MAKFRINEGYNDAKDVTAYQFVEQNSLVIFYADSSRSSQVFAIPVSRLSSIERVEEAS